jgi:hypothetical protein
MLSHKLLLILQQLFSTNVHLLLQKKSASELKEYFVVLKLTDAVQSSVVFHNFLPSSSQMKLSILEVYVAVLSYMVPYFHVLYCSKSLNTWVHVALVVK